MDVVENAIDFDAKSKAELAEKMQELTDLDNPNSVVQMKQWLADNGLEMDSLGKKEVAQAVKTAPKELVEVLLLQDRSFRSLRQTSSCFTMLQSLTTSAMSAIC